VPWAYKVSYQRHDGSREEISSFGVYLTLLVASFFLFSTLTNNSATRNTTPIPQHHHLNITDNLMTAPSNRLTRALAWLRRRGSAKSSKQPVPAPANDPVLPASDKAILPQPDSQLLNLPTELRLTICRFMTLSPEFADSLAWRAAYEYCRRLHQDMRDELGPANDLPPYIAKLQSSAVRPLGIILGQPLPFLRQIRDLVVHLHNLVGTDSWPYDNPESVVRLYLDHLHIIFTGGGFDGAQRNLKTFDPGHLVKWTEVGKVNCKKITLTLEGLADANGGFTMTITGFSNVIQDSQIPYSMTIVQTLGGWQVERVFESATRFRPLPPCASRGLAEELRKSYVEGR
jgi:hypothetical protein